MAADVKRDVIVLDKSDPRTLNVGNTVEQLDNVECLIAEARVGAVFAVFHTSGLVNTPTVVLRVVVDPFRSGTFTVAQGSTAITTAGPHVIGIGVDAKNLIDCRDVLKLPIPPFFGVQFFMTGPSGGDEMVIDWVNLWVT